MMYAEKKDAQARITVKVTVAALLAKMSVAARKPLRRGPLATPGMTTVGLLAVNVALVAVVVGSPPPVQAQLGPPLQFCEPCWEGMVNGGGGWVHANQRFSQGLEGNTPSPFGGAYTYNHDRGVLYDGRCRDINLAHFGAMCCVLE